MSKCPYCGGSGAVLQVLESIESLGHFVQRYAEAMKAALESGAQPEGEASGPRCPKCGSPKFSDISAMGVMEYQCADCGANYAP